MKSKNKIIGLICGLIVIVSVVIYFLIPLPSVEKIDSKFHTDLNKFGVVNKTTRFEYIFNRETNFIGNTEIDDKDYELFIKLSEKPITQLDEDKNYTVVVQEVSIPFRASDLKVLLYSQMDPDFYKEIQNDFKPYYMVYFEDEGLYSEVSIQETSTSKTYMSGQKLTNSDREMILNIMDQLFPNGRKSFDKPELPIAI